MRSPTQSVTSSISFSLGISMTSILRQAAIDLGVKLYGCQMSMDVMEIPREKLIDEVTDCVGAAFYVDQAQQSEISLFI